MKKPERADPQNLSWEEIGFICEGLVLAPRPLREATRGINAEYSLGPRGAWIVHLISMGEVVFPLDLTKMFQIGRSLITAELTRLGEAGLIAYRRSANDGRRVELTLTPLGQTVHRRVKTELTKLVTGRLASYPREQALFFGRMLHDFGTVTPPGVEARSQPERISWHSRTKRPFSGRKGS
jgi:DNA-binding MarR family transcriptional regulator